MVKNYYRNEINSKIYCFFAILFHAVFIELLSRIHIWSLWFTSVVLATFWVQRMSRSEIIIIYTHNWIRFRCSKLALSMSRLSNQVASLYINEYQSHRINLSNHMITIHFFFFDFIKKARFAIFSNIHLTLMTIRISIDIDAYWICRLSKKFGRKHREGNKSKSTLTGFEQLVSIRTGRAPNVKLMRSITD